MEDKKFFIKTISYSLGILLLISVLTIIFDPFVHYHAPFFNFAVTATDERMQQIGVAKNCSYDTAIIGSSMSENFVASWFDTEPFGDSTAKLSIMGGYIDDFAKVLDEVLAKEETKSVIFSFDNYFFTTYKEGYTSSIPEYLENDKYSDDVYYLWNKSVALYYLPMFVWQNFSDGFSADPAYIWNEDYDFGKYVVRASYFPLRRVAKADEISYDSFYERVYSFLDKFEPYIESRPDVTFYLYVPPYSILYWDDCYLSGRLTAEICALNEAYGSLLSHENIRLFYFQDNWDIITNLDYYKDYSHFNQDVSRYIFDCMKNGENEMKPDTYYDRLLKFSEDIADYDFEPLFH